ncbi:hypothetical protein EJ05DRAFT_308944 [Pseudovirgaria hyperparasitica]|uniref:Uncharacterized protein n=1 Tax=Pseudovirgaria hyperparasitica TaxID=470096 RepID=A0A6A6WA85_9PEZI|nr:uncharacterized protein EJ05DRAFT_308944 [Pseudovirgaria hyperparasitica]KAF2759768.1 hypothetical protein EJ05DRAFT_308944 [Pseudovirgaria hyperparasitica]
MGVKPREGDSLTNPIDLDFDESCDSTQHARPSTTHKINPTTTKKRKSTAGYECDIMAVGESPKKKAKKRDTAEEKRLRRWREKPPRSYWEIRDRALTQRMFVVDRERIAGEIPEEVIDLAGTSGNIYTIRIGLVPSCNCPHARKGNQCKHIIYVLSRVLKAPDNLRYQLAFISSELRMIFDGAPPIPSADASESDGNRKPVEDDCPICCEEMEINKEKIVWCKAACGNNMHKQCWEQWAATKSSQSSVTCPYCRAIWQQDDDVDIRKHAKTGTKNDEGYVNVASQLGLTGKRDYSTYNDYWRSRNSNYDNDYYRGYG